MRRKRRLVHPIVNVFWDDACGQQGWRDVKDARHAPTQTVTAGYMVKKTKAGVTIAATLNDQGQCNDVCFVPRGMVTKIEVLRI